MELYEVSGIGSLPGGSAGYSHLQPSSVDHSVQRENLVRNKETQGLDVISRFLSMLLWAVLCPP